MIFLLFPIDTLFFVISIVSAIYIFDLNWYQCCVLMCSRARWEVCNFLNVINQRIFSPQWQAVPLYSFHITWLFPLGIHLPFLPFWVSSLRTCSKKLSFWFFTNVLAWVVLAVWCSQLIWVSSLPISVADRTERAVRQGVHRIAAEQEVYLTCSALAWTKPLVILRGLLAWRFYHLKLRPTQVFKSHLGMRNFMSPFAPLSRYEESLESLRLSGSIFLVLVLEFQVVFCEQLVNEVRGVMRREFLLKCLKIGCLYQYLVSD